MMININCDDIDIIDQEIQKTIGADDHRNRFSNRIDIINTLPSIPSTSTTEFQPQNTVRRVSTGNADIFNRRRELLENRCNSLISSL